MFAIYSAGFASIFACFVVLYHRALTHADQLELDPLERFDATTRRGEMALYASVGALGVLIGLTGVGKQVALGGWIFALLGPLGGWWAVRQAKRRAQLATTVPVAAP